MDLINILQTAIEGGASDVFLVAGRAASMRVGHDIRIFGEERLMPGDTDRLLREIYSLAGRSSKRLEESGDDDFSFALPGISRFRVSAYRQRGTLSAVIRVIRFSLPDPKEFGIPEKIMRLADAAKGMVLVTGPAGSGKSTTLACMVDAINHSKARHIITLEDPIEYLHRHDRSIVSQREIDVDTESYVAALKAALRQSPDVILLGEMREFETMQVAMTAAETGHLLFSTLHTNGCAATIDRIIDVFPPAQQHQIAVQLSIVLNAVVYQQLVPSVDGSMIPMFELMTVNTAIRNMIREHKVPQIEGLMYSAVSEEMFSMDSSLLSACRSGRITRDTALLYATNPDMLAKKLN